MTKIFSVGGGGLKIFLDPTPTLKKKLKFLKHFQNSKSSSLIDVSPFTVLLYTSGLVSLKERLL